MFETFKTHCECFGLVILSWQVVNGVANFVCNATEFRLVERDGILSIRSADNTYFTSGQPLDLAIKFSFFVAH